MIQMKYRYSSAFCSKYDCCRFVLTPEGIYGFSSTATTISQGPAKRFLIQTSRSSRSISSHTDSFSGPDKLSSGAKRQRFFFKTGHFADGSCCVRCVNKLLFYVCEPCLWKRFSIMPSAPNKLNGPWAWPANEEANGPVANDRNRKRENYFFQGLSKLVSGYFPL